MEVVFQRPGMCQRPGSMPGTSGGKVETCQRREGRDVPAAGRSRRASGGKVETCQRRAPAAGTSGRRLRRGTCQRREGRDVPAPGTSGGKVETCQRRAPAAGDCAGNVPAAGRSRRASGGKVETCQRREGRDVPAAGRSRRASGGHQRREGRDVPARAPAGLIVTSGAFDTRSLRR